MGNVDSSETLQVLARAQLALANSMALVIEAVKGKPQEETKVPLVTKPKPSPSEKPKSRPSARGPKAKELDDRVRGILESRPGTSVAELEREINDPDLSRSRLEWSLRRLLERGQINKTGNTCGARYSAVESPPTAPSSSLRVVGS